MAPATASPTFRKNRVTGEADAGDPFTGFPLAVVINVGHQRPVQRRRDLMQDIEQEVEHQNQRCGMRIKEVERAGEDSQYNVGPEKDLQFTPAVGQHFRQHAADHHADHAKADKQSGEVGALPHHPVT